VLTADMKHDGYGYFSRPRWVMGQPKCCDKRSPPGRFVSSSSPKVGGFERGSEPVGIRTIHSNDGVKNAGVTAYKQGSFQSGFRGPPPSQKSRRPFNSSSYNKRRNDGNVGKKTGHLLAKNNDQRAPIVEGKARCHDEQDLGVAARKFQHPASIEREDEYMGDDYRVQEKQRWNGPCKRAQPNHQRPYKQGGNLDLFEEDTLKGPIDTGGNAVELRNMKKQRPQSAPTNKNNKPAWGSPAGRTWKEYTSPTDKMQCTKEYVQSAYEDKWRRDYKFKGGKKLRPFTAGFHGRDLYSSGPNGSKGMLGKPWG